MRHLPGRRFRRGRSRRRGFSPRFITRRLLSRGFITCRDIYRLHTLPLAGLDTLGKREFVPVVLTLDPDLVEEIVVAETVQHYFCILGCERVERRDRHSRR